jgi:glyoxylase-like metal-dependent hydrolase (beta-lactamase superfamily II)
VVRATQVTREQVLTRNLPADAARSAALDQVTVFSGAEPTTLDLGGRAVRVIPRKGHTDSDVSLELDDPSIVFCGDLFWNAMFPNFVDAIPTQLAQSVRALRRERSTVYVPGHGAVGALADYDRYTAMLGDLEGAARKGHAEGLSAADAAAKYPLAASLGEWTMFSKTFYERAFGAWYKELGKS